VYETAGVERPEDAESLREQPEQVRALGVLLDEEPPVQTART